MFHPVFLEELGREGPGGVSQDLVDVATVPQRLVALVLCHDGETLVLVGQLIAAHYSKHTGGENTCKSYQLEKICTDFCVSRLSQPGLTHLLL